ncbi:MAG: DUF2142 domain-containing protein [Bacilli bacterium]|nr:DUF2142 domain-containing protein [Bacilli bacterium]
MKLTNKKQIFYTTILLITYLIIFFTNNYNYLVLLFSIIAIFSYLIGTKIDSEKLDRLLEFFDKKKVTFILQFIISLVFVIGIYKLVYISSYNNYISKYYLILTSVSLEILCIFLSRKLKKIAIEKLFILIAIPIGLAYLVFIIPNHVPDENCHYYSSYNFSNGNLFSNELNGNIPKQILINDINKINTYKNLDDALRLEANYDDTTDVSVSAYNIFVYFPGTIGIEIGKILNLPIYLGFYFARILCFITYLIIAYYIIKILPVGKNIAFVYMLNPMMMQQSISLSADNLINLYCLLFIAYVIKLKYQKEYLSKKELLVLGILMFLIAISKYVYIPIVLLSIILFSKSKKNKKNLIILIIVAIILCCLTYGYTSFFTKSTPNPYVIENNISTTEQLKNIIKSPLVLLKMYYYTFINLGDYFLETFIGAKLGWLNIGVNGLVIKIYMMLLILSPFLFKEENRLNKKEKYLFVGVSIVIFLLIILGLYLSWTGVGQLVALGIQGRYFIPFAILLFIVLCDKNRYLSFKNVLKIETFILLVLHSSVIMTIINFFI